MKNEAEGSEDSEKGCAYESVHAAGMLGSTDQVQGKSACDILLLERDW